MQAHQREVSSERRRLRVRASSSPNVPNKIRGGSAAAGPAAGAGRSLPAVPGNLGASGQGAGCWRLAGRAAGDPRAGESETGAVGAVDFKLSGIWGFCFKKKTVG